MIEWCMYHIQIHIVYLPHLCSTISVFIINREICKAVCNPLNLSQLLQLCFNEPESRNWPNMTRKRKITNFFSLFFFFLFVQSSWVHWYLYEKYVLPDVLCYCDLFQICRHMLWKNLLRDLLYYASANSRSWQILSSRGLQEDDKKISDCFSSLTVTKWFGAEAPGAHPACLLKQGHSCHHLGVLSMDFSISIWR